jgi:sarcosine oxidase
VVRVAVIGAGVVGLATAQQLLLRGVEVDCYEAEAPMAGRSLGDTRIFRLLHADPELAALAMQAKEGWQEWSAMAGKTLVGSEGVLVSGQPAYAWHQATEAAGASVQFSEGLPASCEVPAHRPVGPFAYDAAGGVIDVRSTGEFLVRQLGHRLIAEPVVAIEANGERARIVTAHRDTSYYDAVVVAAGAGTPKLAADAGVRLPDRLERHVRFTFRLEAAITPPCWIERSEAWRSGFTSYSQLTSPTTWAIGAGLPASDVAWELGADEVERRSRAAVVAYVEEALNGVAPTPIDKIACDVTLPGGDGFDAEMIGPIVFVWGDNLFKFAPWLGRQLAKAAVNGEVPPEMHQPPIGD